ncbi:MAG TPA: flagellar basal-body rod protein FlgF [Egibacteraceae bacterium]|jgi:flagellar hook protein FlgE|nr:flagellar basal-body rod protein FlgF [Egibacteraceae bacterium]
MLRSMFAGVSGLRAHQTMMDVVGNNIANVNTTGYKSSRVTFQEALTQVVRGGTGAVAGVAGGINPMQLGLGARMASVDGVFSQGATQVTGRATDLAIQGEGFFVVSTPDGPRYTRAGAFAFDAAGNLVGPAGELVVGTDGNPVQVADLQSYVDVAIDARGRIMGRDVAGQEVELGQIAVARFANPGGLERIGGTLFAATANSGAAQVGEPGTDGRGSLQAGTLEMSNVDLAQEFTNLILAQRGFQANARTITASDEMLQDLVNLKR